MNADQFLLTMRARQVAGLNQRTLGDLLGLSRRTIQRWDGGRGSPSTAHWHKIARAIFPYDAALSAQIAAQGGATLEQLGLVLPSPAAPPHVSRGALHGARTSTVDASWARHLADVVVCAASEALAVPPQAARPALLAAFSKAFEVRLTVEDLVAALTPAIPPPARAASGKA